MNYRVVKSTDSGYVAASEIYEDFKQCLAECKRLMVVYDDYFAVQELPSGSVSADAGY